MANTKIEKKKCGGACSQTLSVSEFDKKSNGQYYGQCRKCRTGGKKKDREKNYPFKSIMIDDDLYKTVMKDM